MSDGELSDRVWIGAAPEVTIGTWSNHARLVGIERDDDYESQGERWLRLGQELVGRSLDAAT